MVNPYPPLVDAVDRHFHPDRIVINPASNTDTPCLHVLMEWQSGRKAGFLITVQMATGARLEPFVQRLTERLTPTP